MVKIARAVMSALSIRRKDRIYRWYVYHHV
jgi:hypothetical protein